MGIIRSKSNTFFLWIFFLIYPLGAFVVAIRNYRFKEFRIFILLFLSLLGYTYIPVPNSDGDRHKNEFVSTVTYGFEKYVNDINSVIKGTAESKDFYIISVKYISLLLSTDFKIFFLILAILYFSVFLKVLETLWDNIILISKENLVYFIGICFVLNITAGVSGIRFPMAFWVFSYGSLNLIFKNEFKYLLIASLSVLIHFSLGFSMVFLILFYVSRFTSNRNVLFLLLATVAIVAAVIPSTISSYLTIFGSAQEESINAYSNEDYIEGRENLIEEWNWYLKINFYSYYYFFIAVLVLTKLKFFNVNFDTISNRLFGFGIIMTIQFLLTATFLDPISNRYMTIFYLFGLIYMFYLASINQGNKFMKITRNIFIPILMLNILIKIRADLYSISPVLAFGNAISVFIYDSAVSVQDYLLN
jgi:hypothetical protein